MANTELKFKDKDEAKTAESSKKKVSGMFARLKAVKNIEIYIAVFAVAAMLLIYFTSKSSSKGAGATESPAQNSGYCEKMESNLETALSSIKDAGKTIVVVNWESGVEAVIAYTTNSSSSSSSSTPQIIQSNGSSQPIILKEIYPKALGVIVVCEGGDRPGVRMDIINAVSNLLAITTDKINVFAMAK